MRPQPPSTKGNIDGTPCSESGVIKMSRFRALWLGAAVMLAFGAVTVITGPGQHSVPRLPGEIMLRKAGQKFCPVVPLAYHSVIVPAGRCYVMSVMHDSRGMFLAFAPEDAHVTGRLVRLDTPSGLKLKSRLLLVPIRTSNLLAPMNTLAFVATEIEDSGMHFSIKVLDTPVANLVVVMDVQA
jgi:hypothetical protein